VFPALADTIARFEIPTRYFHDLILGAEMDLTVATYATFDRLSEYCYRVAGTVGLTCIHVFGFSDPKAPDLAERLGLAFQLTNIIRDVGSDYAIGRVYLPQEAEDSRSAGIRSGPRLADVCGRRAAGEKNQCGQPGHVVGAGPDVQHVARADRRARLRRFQFADFDVERRKNPISPDGGDDGLVEEGCPRKAFW
jgi:hypothetical protein